MQDYSNRSKAIAMNMFAQLKKMIPKGIRSSYRTLRAPRTAQITRPLPILRADAGESLALLLRAWQVGRPSDPFNPGSHLVYYSLEKDGYNFPGARPWSNRWETLRCITDYRGKRVLELGCNMALLSCYLLKYAGAQITVAVDMDSALLLAAQDVAAALDADPALIQCNFDSVFCWETNLLGFRPDIVFALSVFHWIRDKDRFGRFLALAPELIYEGHDSPETEVSRLTHLGFGKIRLVGLSELGRPILHCLR